MAGTTSPAFWDKMAESYARSPIDDPEAYEYTLGRTLSYLGPTNTVLELGAGTSSTALRLAPSVARYLSTDYSAGMVEIGRAKAEAAGIEGLEVAQAGFESDFDGAPFDVVLALNLLHLVEDVDGALARIAALTRPGGLFISKTITRFGGNASWKHRLMLMALPVAQVLGKAPFVRILSIPEWEAKVTAAGFEIVESGNFPARPPNRYLVARRVG